MAMSILMLILGLVVLTVGAEILVKNASRLAVNMGISPLVVGLTVVAFGTSAPELVVSLHASMTGKEEVAIGNVIGSNIFNILFILGISAIIVPLKVSQQLIRFDVPLMVGLSVLVWLMSWNGKIGRVDGLILTAGLIAYTVWSIVQSRREQSEVISEYEREYGVKAKVTPLGMLLNLVFLVFGLGLLVVGTRFFVDAAVDIARTWGVSELVIGLTIVAVGTSLPEVATSVMAAVRGERDIAVGNAVGSNIFNILCVLGISGLVSDSVLVADPAFRFDMPIMIAVAIACLPIFFTGQSIARWEGCVFFGYYIAYMIYLILSATKSTMVDEYEWVMAAFVIPLTLLGLVVAVVREVWKGKHENPIADGPTDN
jgi:cation:H+ antiporter